MNCVCVDTRVGKDWAKGLTAKTDGRIAPAAAGHRGKQYVRRTPHELCRWPLLPLKWSNEMAYVVGLTATDGCLVTGRRAINFKSGDRELVETYLRLLGRTNPVKNQKTRARGIRYFTQFHDSLLYEWFRSVGLTPRKSLTIGALPVPDEFFLPLMRGLLDGDGSIINKIYRADTGSKRDYYWEYLITSFNSASAEHVRWLQGAIARILGLSGSVQMSTTTAGNPYFGLRFGKLASSALLPLLYTAGAPCLGRKRQIWDRYASRQLLTLG